MATTEEEKEDSGKSFAGLCCRQYGSCGVAQKCDFCPYLLSKMQACMHGNTCRPLKTPNGDGVIFKNIKTRYSPNEVVLVEYILSPKVVTSSKDYIGLYPRGWKSLKQFVAFESTIISPSDEPSLFRSIEFHPRFRVDTVTFFRDYQFIYVTHTFNVLGSSIYFQFHPDTGTDRAQELSTSLESFCLSSPEYPASLKGYHAGDRYRAPHSPPVAFMTGSEDGTSQIQTAQDSSAAIQSISDMAAMNQMNQFSTEDVPGLSLLTPEEIAYNKCFFLFGSSGSGDEAPNKHSVEDQSFLLNEASNALATSKGMASLSTELGTIESPVPVRGRALVKTKDNSTIEFRNVSPSPPPLRRSRSTKGDNPVVNFESPSSPTRNKPWTLTKPVYNIPVQYHLQDTFAPSVTYAPHMVSPAATGAIPKRCGKCKCPSDYLQLQMKLEHQLKQAHEEIHDLKANLDSIKQELELAKVGQAKQRLLRDLVKHEAKDVTTFVNNLMASLTRNETVRIVNFDSTVMEVTRQIVSPGYLLRKSAPKPKTFVYGRPANVKIMSPRHKEMKAIIGHQEMKIRDLQAKLNLANDLLVKSTNSTSHHLTLNLESSCVKSIPISFSPQLTPGPCEGIASLNSGVLSPLPHQVSDRVQNEAFASSSSSSLCFGFEGIQEEVAEGPVEGLSNSAEVPGHVTVKAPELFPESFVVEPVFFPTDEAQYGNREVIADEDQDNTHGVEDPVTVQSQSDSNNNNNGSKCVLCEPDGGDRESLDFVVSEVGKLGVHQGTNQNDLKGL